MTISRKILDITTPFWGEFARGKYRVYSHQGQSGGDRYIIGESLTDGLGVFYSYNASAIPEKISEDRLVKEIGVSFDPKNFNEVVGKIVKSLLSNGYCEIVGSDLFEGVGSLPDIDATMILDLVR